MKVSREQMEAHRRKIVEAAGRLFRARGFEAVTVAEVMQEAGLTHGGFYRHFKSKDELIAVAIAEALDVAATLSAETDPVRYAAGYLTRAHRDDLGGGCPVAGMGAETIRQAPEARAAMTADLRRQIDRFAKGAAGKTAAARRQAAIGSWAAMLGAMVLARMSDDEKLSDEVLAATKAWLAGRAG
jgi:TetR/AcrR family transcriptional repressor of nem operon